MYNVLGGVDVFLTMIPDRYAALMEINSFVLLKLKISVVRLHPVF